jgi:hypothetical protein
LLQLLQQARQAFSDRDIAGYQATMHDILGLAGLYEKKVLHEMIREIKQQGFALSEHEATHLFAEVELLIR